MMNSARARSFLAGLLWTLSGAAFAADAFPTRALTLVVPYSEGGSSDTRARQVARHMSTHLGQPVQVVNHAGDGGNKGTDLIAKARPDGYTFGLGNLAPMTVNRHLNPALPFNPKTDLRAIGMIERGPLVLMVSADADFATAQAMLDKAKNGTGRLRYASAGVGGSFHLAVELLEQQVGFTAQHVPFDGGGKATEALFQKKVDFKFDGVPSAVALLSETPPKVRALAVASRRRSPVLPGVPTFRELGIDGMEVSNWLGLVAPSGTPDVVIERLNQALLFSLSQSDVGSTITRNGNELGAGPPMYFDAFMSAESYRWGRLIREKKISP
ncbi:Bug family tripartite tricarboxylate transporter substrate binding protein [Hydrogenophaga sp. SL48]|uniref:Bug family tripartite tricarboxylate transporter substrate binding protein n=1 Tax=Hydrogenophaga sp. SL48 TaxID=2806347 RepID=UPI001F22278D|nr:tripartite tricarboxylate transporter substrate binding protein [Hydrogenophaga sp. SL48]UJW83139.1 tripartite tricarboxylate transporter substrate binding protein [Hydrogenophaga sp. SL48]